MIRFRRFDIVERFPIVADEGTSDYALDLLDFLPPPPVTDLIQIHGNPFHTSTRRVTQRVGLGELHLQTLCDRVSNLELAFERLVSEEKGRKKISERKFTWTAEIKGKGGAYPPIERTYTVKVSNGDSSSDSEREEKVKKKKKKCQKVKKGKPVGSNARNVEIEGPSDHGGVVLRQVFAKRMEKKKGKSKELSLEDAAALIQMSFRTYLIRRSQCLRALRELAIAKTKLKEIRTLFNNFSYRRRLSRDAEEHQRFSEKIIVLLLTVDAIEGAEPMVRAAKKSMVDELKAMLDVVDPQLPGKSTRNLAQVVDA